MRYLRILLAFSAEVAGIVIVGYVLHETTDISSIWIGIGVAVLLLLAHVKLLLLFMRVK